MKHDEKKLTDKAQVPKASEAEHAKQKPNVADMPAPVSVELDEEKNEKLKGK
jgi:hypothetical protein